MAKRSIIASLLLITSFYLLLSGHKPELPTKTINPIVGDQGFIETYGYAPDENTDDQLRIRTHLAYVEKKLRQKPIQTLSPAMLTKRERVLNLLHEYWQSGIFPKNHDYTNDRKPCFIDKEGNICAVGYLVEKTVGRELAELINKKHQYETIYEMKDPALEDWVSNSGLTKEECAMIQPTYAPPVPITNESSNITAANAIASSTLSGLNLTLCTMNKMQLSKFNTSKTVATVGIVTGLGQLIYGIKSYPKDVEMNPYITLSNDKQKTLSMVNIAVGTSTLLLSSWNYFRSQKNKNKQTSWILHDFQNPDKSTGLAVTMIKRF